jgi:hypothetical protein
MRTTSPTLRRRIEWMQNLREILMRLPICPKSVRRAMYAVAKGIADLKYRLLLLSRPAYQ